VTKRIFYLPLLCRLFSVPSALRVCTVFLPRNNGHVSFSTSHTKRSYTLLYFWDIMVTCTFLILRHTGHMPFSISRTQRVICPSLLLGHKGHMPFSTSQTQGLFALLYFSDIRVTCLSLLLIGVTHALLYFSDIRVTCPSLLLGHECHMPFSTSRT